MENDPIPDATGEQKDPHPLIKDPVEHNQRNALRVVVWVALVAVILSIAVSLGWHSHRQHISLTAAPSVFVCRLHDPRVAIIKCA
jgi:hypothetical protein